MNVLSRQLGDELAEENCLLEGCSIAVELDCRKPPLDVNMAGTLLCGWNLNWHDLGWGINRLLKLLILPRLLDLLELLGLLGLLGLWSL